MSASTFAISLFADVFAKEITEVTGTIEDLAETIRTTTAPAKDRLPLLKLARFGSTAIPHTGSLRHDQNCLAVTGVEGDYDGCQVSLDEAHERLLKANISAVLCATPSYTPEKPKWRALCPFSGKLPPENRAHMVDRLNGALGGILAAESWTLSQSFYYGSVNSNPYHRVEIIDGEPIDLIDDLDLIAVGKPNGGGAGGKSNGNGRTGCPVDEEALKKAIVSGEAYHESCTRLLGKWIREGVGFDEAECRLFALFDAVDESLRDARWAERRADIQRTVDGIFGKDARRQDDADAEFNDIQIAIGALQHGASVSRIIDRIASAQLSPTVEGRLLDLIKEKTHLRIGDLRDELKDANGKIKAQQKEVVRPSARWMFLVTRNESGAIIPTMSNVCIILRNDPHFCDAFGYDEFADEIAVVKPLPTEDPNNFRLRHFTLDDELAVTEWIQHTAELNVHKNIVFDAVRRISRERTFHPVRDYLNFLQWDDTPRIDKLLTDYFNATAAPIEYLQAVGARAMIQSVARIFRPGVKADCMLLIDGDQGKRKSMALRMLFDPNDLGWFVDHIPDLGSKDAAIQLRGKWLLEFSELSALRRSDTERTKAWLSQTDDEYRPPYERKRVKFSRQNTFAGTTNDDDVLKDASGNRRYWPFKAGDINVDKIWEDRHELWAEAVHRYRTGEKWWIDEPALKAIAEGEQTKYQATDVWESVIADYLEEYIKEIKPKIMTAENYQQNKTADADSRQNAIDNANVGVTTAEILTRALGKKIGDASDNDQKRIGQTLRKFGFLPEQVRKGLLRGTRYYFPRTITIETKDLNGSPVPSKSVCYQRVNKGWNRGTAEK